MIALRTVTFAASAWIAALAACSSESVGPPPAPPVNWQSFRVRAAPDAGQDALTAREREVAERYVAALESAEFTALGTELDDDVRFSFPGADEVHGRSAAVHAHDALLGAFDGRHVAATRIFRTSSEQTVEWTMTGLQAREWMGIPATHKPIAVKGVTLLFTKDDGSIVDVHIYFDIAAAKAQLGVGPKELLAAARAPSAAIDDAGVHPTAVYEQNSSPEEKENVAAARGALDALENDNLTAYDASFADDVEVSTSERAARWRGKTDTTAYFKAMQKAVGELDTTITEAWGVGSFAVVEYTIAGEQRAALGWIPAQRDKAIRFHIVDVIEIRGATIARVWRYENPSEVMASPPA